MLDLHKLAEDRRAIFTNVANGVPADRIRSAFKVSQTDIDREVRFVGRKICEYRFRRHLPPLPCKDLRDIRWHRRALLENLSKLGPEYLASELILPPIVTQQVDSPEAVQDISRRVGRMA